MTGAQPVKTAKWFTKEALKLLNNSVGAFKMPKIKRVRRRGFRADIRRGDSVQRDGITWTVSRRSNWYLWLYEQIPMTGQTILVTVPKRFQVR